MDGELVARTYHDLDDTAQPADRTAAPARGDKVALLSAERLDPALVDAALGGEVGENRGQQRLEVVHGRLREGDDPEPVTQRRRQRIQRIRRGDIAHLAEIERDLHGRIRITGRSLGLEEAEQTVPDPAIVGSRAGLFEFVDHDDRVGLLEARDRQERMEGSAVCQRLSVPPNMAPSLRHTYICLRLMEGADIYQIAKNCRTSVEMIEKYYASHIKTRLDAAAINVRRPKSAKKRVQLASDEELSD